MLQTASLNLAAWTMLAVCFFSIAFLLWFLIGIVVEGRQRAAVYLLGSGDPEPASRRLRDEQTAVPGLAPRYSFRFDLNGVASGSVRKGA